MLLGFKIGPKGVVENEKFHYEKFLRNLTEKTENNPNQESTKVADLPSSLHTVRQAIQIFWLATSFVNNFAPQFNFLLHLLFNLYFGMIRQQNLDDKWEIKWYKTIKT